MSARDSHLTSSGLRSTEVNRIVASNRCRFWQLLARVSIRYLLHSGVDASYVSPLCDVCTSRSDGLGVALTSISWRASIRLGGSSGLADLGGISREPSPSPDQSFSRHPSHLSLWDHRGPGPRGHLGGVVGGSRPPRAPPSSGGPSDRSVGNRWRSGSLAPRCHSSGTPASGHPPMYFDGRSAAT